MGGGVTVCACVWWWGVQVWCRHGEIVDKSLQLLQELAGGYSSGKTLLKLDVVVFALQHHGPAAFPFLSFADGFDPLALDALYPPGCDGSDPAPLGPHHAATSRPTVAASGGGKSARPGLHPLQLQQQQHAGAVVTVSAAAPSIDPAALVWRISELERSLAASEAQARRGRAGLGSALGEDSPVLFPLRSPVFGSFSPSRHGARRGRSWPRPSCASRG